MLTLTSPGLAAIASNPVPLAVLVEMMLSGGAVYLNTSSLNLTIGGNTYLGTGGLGKIDTVQDSPAEIKPLRFELSGVPSTAIALVVSTPVQGAVVNVKVALYDPSTYAIIETQLKWSGFIDTMTISDGHPTATISVNAEHAGIDLIRPAGNIYSDADQQMLYPGDPSLQYLATQIDMRVIWPSAAYFYR